MSPRSKPIGRPPGPPKTRLAFYLPDWLVRRIRAHENQSEFVEQCIMEATGWDKPGRIPNKKRKKTSKRKGRIEIASVDDLDRLSAGA